MDANDRAAKQDDAASAPGPAHAGAPDERESQAQSGPLPAIALPRGGGAIRGIGETLAANPVTGTASLQIPIAIPPGRSGFAPHLALSYDSGSGNGVFGWGFTLSAPAITRRTDKGLPLYRDSDESDTFVLSGVDDLVPVLVGSARHEETRTTADGRRWVVRRYRPRIEGLFARIERWTDASTGVSHFRSITKDDVVTLYGVTDAARIADPADPTRIFSWLIEESRDDKGNVIAYVYKPEDATGVDPSLAHEQNRLALGAGFANRHIKRVRWGNRTPSQTDAWLFEVVFDYGEHDDVAPRSIEESAWSVRPDPFSRYRSGFEVRTYRLCRRVLVFHLFSDELGPEPTLVRSLDLDYGGSTPVASFITAITQRGWLRNADGRTYQSKSLPPLSLEFSRPVTDPTVKEIDGSSVANVPYGLGVGYQWVDLYKEGLSGILTQQAGAWFYKPNEGDGVLGPARLVAETPAISDLSHGRTPILDLDADARNELVELRRPLSGFHPQTDDGRWGPFVPFASTPNVDWDDRNLRFVDLTGDGRADLLVTENEVFTWYPGSGTKGFGAASRVAAAVDERRGPRLVFSRSTDGGEAIYLADMTGDGLVDLVRVRNGEVCYWPNLGYGRFGAKVTMTGSPTFDGADVFSQARLRLADVDGSGTTDVLYVGRDAVWIYFNQSGNSLSAPQVLTELPPIDDGTDVEAIDLLGNGTACLVFSSKLPAGASRPMHYVDLMGGVKPHLLVRVVNNLGAETRVAYTPSTRFYLDDLRAGVPWITKLPFPVHLVTRVETYDAVAQNRFVTRYAYHHGHYDGVERELRGFGMVEQWDTEELSALQAGDLLPPGANDVDPASHAPPIHTKTWFHTGAYRREGAVARQFAAEYWRKPGQSDADFAALLLDDTGLPPGLSYDEEREACRALKGAMLRQEIYAEDGSSKATIPYLVTERNYTIATVQPQGVNRYASFYVHARETIDTHYEREPEDPRVAHQLVLEIDPFGNVLRAASVGYGRNPAYALSGPDGVKQTQLLCKSVEHDLTNAVDAPDAYRAPLGADSREYEVTGLPAPTAPRLTFAVIDAATQAATEIPNEATPGPGLVKRLLERARTLYRADDLTGPLPLGQLQSMALPYETYKLALTPGLLQSVFGGRVTDAMTTSVGGYVRLGGGQELWAPSGRVHYSPTDGDSPATELAYARAHFFLPCRARDPFGQTTTLAYDAYSLLGRELRDPLGNLTTADLDYRVLQPWRVSDPNRNRSAVAFDALGCVVATALMGKEGAGEGDTLDDPTMRLEYDLGAWMTRGEPTSVHTYARERHGASNPRWQESWAYSDGFGREVQRKVQAEPGPLVDGGPIVAPRWVGSGWTIFNNKGKPVRKYEPFFTATASFERAKVVGVSPILLYDPLQRVVATIHPNHSWEKVVFDPWLETTWDANDTVSIADPSTDEDVGGYVARLPSADWSPTWYAQRAAGALGAQEQAAATKAAMHAATPTVAHVDALGRTFLTIADNGAAGKYATRVEVDIQGRERSITDARGRVVARYDFDALGTRLHQATMDAGERWTLSDVKGKPIWAWDSRQHVVRSEYDALRRVVAVHLAEGGGPERLVGRTVYGEALPSPESLNLRGAVYQLFDGAGVATNEAFDFKGNLLRATRQLAVDYKSTLDWSASVPLEARTYATSSTFDALNRPTSVTTPDGSIVKPSYNEANLLERLDANVRGAAAVTSFVTNFDYDAKGQRTLIEYGNGARTTYAYDPLTFRLARLSTVRGSDALQDLNYTYDPVGNVTYIRDAAQQTTYFRNQRVEPSADYTYDAVYRLTAAVGREHLGQTMAPAPTGPTDAPRVGLLQPGDGQAMGRYLQQYVYDEVGNLLQLAHRGTDPTNAGWTRTYAYGDASLLEPAQRGNRLSATTVGSDTSPYSHDAHGNVVSMPHLSRMQWDYRDLLTATAQQVVNAGTPDTTYYVYDASGQRVRKVTELASGARKEERIYLGDFEVYRTYEADGSTVDVERETLHVREGSHSLALVETRTQGSDPGLAQVARYQLGNHLGSAVLELDDTARIVSYEEYYPYGSTSYQAVRAQTETPKRYRYCGMERDTETGFSYHGARYYAPWLGRWTAADPKGLADGVNVYAYAHDCPTKYVDPRGTQATPHKVNIVHMRFTGKETEAELHAIARGHGVDFTGHPRWVPESESWDVGTIKSIAPADRSKAEKAAQGIAAGGQGASRAAPKGPTLEVPNSYDAQKMRAYQRGVQRGEIGRNAGSGQASTRLRRNTPQQRAARAQHEQMEAEPTDPAPGGRGYNQDHIIELQHDLTGESGTRPGDYRWQDAAQNQLEGSQSWNLNKGNTQGEAAGGVSKVGEATRWFNRPGYRAGVRWGGRALTAYAIYQSGKSIYNAVERDLQEGTYGEHTATAVAEEAGGWAGALALGEAGAALGAMTGPLAPILAPLFGLIGGAIGYFGGKAIVDGLIDAGKSLIDAIFD